MRIHLTSAGNIGHYAPWTVFPWLNLCVASPLSHKSFHSKPAVAAGVKSTMKLITTLLILAFSFHSYAGDKGMPEVPGKSIHIDQLVEMFSNIRESTDWDVSGDMLWGYFFTHNEPRKLEAAKEILVAKGYHFVDIYLSDKDGPNESDLFWLHVERIETHSPESLDKRNNELYHLAYDLGIDTYDGMDIGPIAK